MGLNRAIFFISISFTAGTANASDWNNVYNGDSASIAIVGAATHPQIKVPLLEVEDKMNHMNAPSYDGKKIIKSMRILYLVNCADRRFNLFQIAGYEGDNQKGEPIDKNELAGVMDPTFKQAEAGSSEEYMIEKVCSKPKL